MSHPEQVEYCEAIKYFFPHYFTKCIVLDAGSLEINGSNRGLFCDCDYYGADIMRGKNVDIVDKIHNLGFHEKYFNTIISTECFEHDMYYPLSIRNIVRMLKPNGLFLFTCASTGRAEHGTKKNRPMDSPFTATIDGWMEYYKNLTEDDIRLVMDVDKVFEEYEFETKGTDLRFFGIKKDGPD